MTRIDRGDIVLIRFTFGEGTRTKVRPGLVLSSAEYHRGRKDVILAAITSNVDRILVGDTKLHGWKEAGLKFPSAVTGIVQTMKAGMIDRKLGTLPADEFHRVERNLKLALGF